MSRENQNSYGSNYHVPYLAWTCFALFMDVLNKHVPLVTRRVKNKQIPGWMNRDIIRQICVRDKLKARAKHSALARTMYKNQESSCQINY